MQDVHKLETMLQEDGIVFLTYGGFLTQPLIVAMTDALEKEAESSDLSMKVSHNIFTVFIELSQNMMNYSKKMEKEGVDPKGLILVGKNSAGEYYVMSQNILDEDDKNKIEPKLKLLTKSTKDEIKKLYREIRKNGSQAHEKGGGIGFYEIAKRCEKISYEFQKIENGKYYFKFKGIVGKN